MLKFFKTWDKSYRIKVAPRTYSLMRVSARILDDVSFRLLLGSIILKGVLILIALIFLPLTLLILATAFIGQCLKGTYK